MSAILRALQYPSVEALGWSLLHFLWQGLVLAGVLSLVLVALRRSSSHTRYLVLCTGMGVMALCPVATWYVAAVWIQSNSVLQNYSAESTGPLDTPTSIPTAVSNSTGDFPRDDLRFQPNALERQKAFAEQTSAAESRRDADIPAATSSTIVSQNAKTFTMRMRRWQGTLSQSLPWLISGWVIGVLVLSIQLMTGWRAVQRLRRLALSPASNDLQARLSQLAGRLGVTKSVKLIESALVVVPTVIGWLRPIILLPTSAVIGLDSAQLEALLAHELAHIRRNDFIVNLIQTAIETLLFYHPAVWWLSHRIRNEREHCCDDIAVEVCDSKFTYAKALATMEELREPAKLSMAADGGSLIVRIRRLISPDSENRRSSWGASLIAMLTLLVIGEGLHYSSSVKADAQDTPKPAQKYIAELPGNIQVEMVGVAYHPSKDRTWWSAGGTKLAIRPYEKSGVTIMGGSPEQAECREFQLEIRGLPTEHAVKMELGGGAFGMASQYANGRWEMHAAAGRFKAKTVTIRMGLTTELFGPKQSVDLKGKKFDAPELAAPVQKLYDLFEPSKVEESVGKTEVLLNGKQLNDLGKIADFQLVAIDTETNPQRSTGSSSDSAGVSRLSFPLPLARIARFEYRIRPYRHWVTFENVSLEPGQETDVVVKTETLPGGVQPAETSTIPAKPAAQNEPLSGQLIAGLKAAAENFSTGKMHVDFINYMQPFKSKIPQPLSKRVGTVDWLRDGNRWRIDYVGQLGAPRNQTPKLVPDLWSTGFNGEHHYYWDREQNRVSIGSMKGHADQYDPENLFWQPTHGGLDAMLKTLMRPETKIAASELNGLPGYRTEYEVRTDGVWRSTAFICPQRSHLGLQLQNFRNDQLIWEGQLSDLTEVQTGVWYPKTIQTSSYRWTDGKRETTWQQDFKIAAFELPPENSIPQNEFVLQPAYGVDVINLIDGIAYQNDIWWTDLAPILRERLDWPKPPLSPLDRLNSHFNPKAEETPIPELDGIELSAVEKRDEKHPRPVWLNSKPLTWQQLEGKVTLVVFWGQFEERSLESLAAVKRLHAIYAPHGLQILAVHYPETPAIADGLTTELKLPFPSLVDGGGTSLNGVLCDALGARGMPTAIFIDHQHKRQPIVDAQKFLSQLSTLLTAAGAKNLPEIKRKESSDVPDKEIRAAWLELLDKAPNTASIVGKVVDGQNRPIANAQIQALQSLHLLSSVLGSHMVLPNFKGKLNVQADADGTFALPNLTKGQYELTITAPGKAVSKQEITLGEGVAQSVAITLNFSDFIKGQVTDINGKPIANAKVQVLYQHFDLENLDRRTSSPGAMPVTTTDAAGRFNFEKLPTARYSIEIIAAGFQTGTAEKILLGKSDVEIKLKPTAAADSAPGQ
jgi:beta-lactamase regulating signal transducer with metallopeptidase domain/protocatechuate 3,4-dioxygenase beta subunit